MKFTWWNIKKNMVAETPVVAEHMNPPRGEEVDEVIHFRDA